MDCVSDEENNGLHKFYLVCFFDKTIVTIYQKSDFYVNHIYKYNNP